MKKSITCLLLVALICMLTMFLGCDSTPNKVRYTVELIAQLEGQTITLDHEEQISKASREYNSLPLDLRQQVYNYDVLKKAQEELIILSEQVKNINAKIANIGTDIAPEDIPTLQAIADEYALLRQDTHEYINGYEKISIPLKNYDKW